MELTLHLGAHRTASSSLQRYLAQHRPALARAGAVAWTPPDTRDGRLAGLIGDPGRVSARRDLLAKRSGNRVRLCQQVLKDTGHDQLVISDENLLGGMRENFGLGALYPTAMRRLARVSEVLPAVHTVALSLRSYEHYWASVMAHMILRGAPVPDAEHIAHIAGQTRQWRDVVRDVAACFPSAEINVWTFEDLGALPHVAASALIGDALPAPKEPIHVNASPTATRLQEMLLETDGNPTMIRSENGVFAPFTPAQRASLAASYAMDIDWLRAGADGLATYIDHQAMSPVAQFSDREGTPSHDGQDFGPDPNRPHETMAGTRDAGVAGKAP